MFGAQKRAADFGFDSIGAVATTKVQNNSLTAGFPSAYQSFYAKHEPKPRYYPRIAEGRVTTMWAGDDLQAQLHQQRKQDADFMAGAKVRSTQLSRIRYVGTPHGRGELPPHVLGQRIFANVNNGAFETNSAREDIGTAPFHLAGAISHTQSLGTPLRPTTEGFHQNPLVGGVLRTWVGQRHGKMLLDNRIDQLNRIMEEKQSFKMGMPTNAVAADTTTNMPNAVGTSSAVELNLLLQSIIDACVGGEDIIDEEGRPVGTIEIEHLTSTTYKDTTRALSLIFSLAPSMSQNELDDTYGKVDLIVNSVDAILSTGHGTTVPPQSREIALTLQVLFTKLRAYLEAMVAARNLSPKERVDVSKSAVNTLGFTKMLKYANESYQTLLSEADKNKLMTAQQRQRYREGDMDRDSDSGSSSGSDRGGGGGYFDAPAGPRENADHATETGETRGSRNFTPDVRQEFGAQSGQYFTRGVGVYGTNQFFNDPSVPTAGDPTRGSLPARPASEIPPEERAPLMEATRVPPTPAASVSGVWDPDTQAFNVSTRGLSERAAPVARRRARLSEPVASAATSAVSVGPRRQSELPTTREGFLALQSELLANGIRIGINTGSTVASIRKNFIKHLNLAGKP